MILSENRFPLFRIMLQQRRRAHIGADGSDARMPESARRLRRESWSIVFD
jgi:hypothetical protein